MKYKLVAIDLDGTLLNNDHEIPAENITTIRELRELGVQFVVVTGRADAMARKYVNTLGIKAPILACNGATMRDVLSDEVYYLKHIARKPLIELYNFFKSKNLYPRFYALDAVYTYNPDELNEDKNSFAIFSKRLAEYMDLKLFDNIEDLLATDVKITKLVYAAADVATMIPLQEELKQIQGIEILRAAKNVLDIVTENVSKGKALLEYANGLGIDGNEIVAIGDGENDLSMLSAVGFPVTLENGEACLKAIARMVTVSNDEAGVAKALKAIFSGERGNDD
ncbi:MAG: HAD family hydrolase [Negativicutes bacterium]